MPLTRMYHLVTPNWETYSSSVQKNKSKVILGNLTTSVLKNQMTIKRPNNWLFEKFRKTDNQYQYNCLLKIYSKFLILIALPDIPF